MANTWHVYMVECADGTLYSGIPTDIDRRIKEHNESDKGPRYTRPKRPVLLGYSEEHADRSAASKREYELKQLSREEKKKLFSN